MRSKRVPIAIVFTLVFGMVKHLNADSATLLDAIRANNNNRIEALLRDGADPNSKDETQASALMYAALYASPHALELLIRAGAKVNHRDANGMTALFWAAHSYNSAKILIEAGADINLKSGIGSTPLVTAAAYPGNTELLQLMMDKGADIKTTVSGATALTMAAWTGDAQNVALLLKRGADPNAMGFNGTSALHSAVTRGDRQMVQLLIAAGADIQARTMQDEDVLERYGFWNDPVLVRMLLDRGVDPSRKDRRGHNALLFASSSDTVTPAVLSLLVKPGSPTADVKNAYGDNVLQTAQRHADPRILGLLGGTSVTPVPVKVRHVEPTAEKIGAGISRALELLAKTGPSVTKQRGCFSCHHQGLPSLAASYARRVGIGSEIAETNRQLVRPVLERSRTFLLHGAAPAGEAAAVAWMLLGLAADEQPADSLTDIAVNYLANTQMPDGSWVERWGRPPLEYSAISATAVAVRALDLYGFAGRRTEFNQRINRAVTWLAKAKPAASEERSMRLLGLVWGRAPSDLIRQAAGELASAQRVEGGWRQLPWLTTDAYATGQALVALRDSGYFQRDAAAFTLGVKYLLGTQEEDGSWHVRSRALPVQPLFESGFPHGRDQWISAAGTSWAAMALSLALPSRRAADKTGK